MENLFRCNVCNRTFTTPDVVGQVHPYGNGCALERYLACPYCCGDYERIFECEVCGGYFEADDMSALTDGVCQGCEEG